MRWLCVISRLRTPATSVNGHYVNFGAISPGELPAVESMGYRGQREGEGGRWRRGVQTQNVIRFGCHVSPGGEFCPVDLKNSRKICGRGKFAREGYGGQHRCARWSRAERRRWHFVQRRHLMGRPRLLGRLAKAALRIPESVRAQERHWPWSVSQQSQQRPVQHQKQRGVQNRASIGSPQ